MRASWNHSKNPICFGIQEAVTAFATSGSTNGIPRWLRASLRSFALRDFAMPLFTALNLYNDTITKIAIYADLAMEDPAYQDTALWLIHDLCHRTDESVENIFAGVAPRKE